MQRNTTAVRKLLGRCRHGALVACIASAVSAATATAVTVRKDFSFGPGAFNSTEATVFLRVPASTGPIGVAVEFATGLCSNSVNVQVFQSSSGSIGTTGPNGALLRGASTSPCGTFFFTGVSFNSEFGCPRTFRVRISSPTGLPPPARVSGNVIFVFDVPNTAKVLMEPGKIASLSARSTADDRILSGLRSGESSASRLHLAQQGTFRIRGKWHTDPLSLLINDFRRLTVSLIRPDGTVANSQSGFSAHAPSSLGPKLDFTYTATSADAQLAGTWKLRVRNGTTVRIVDFNLESSLDSGLDLGMPAFTSRFSAACADAAGLFSLEPTQASVAPRQTLNYAFRWDVPEPLVWSDLSFLKFRFRNTASEDDGVFSLFFNVADRTVALLDEGTGRIGPSKTLGQPGALHTEDAALDLGQSSLATSGPTGTSVTLNLAMEFKPHAAGRTYSVEVAASDDEGGRGLYEPAGTVVVTPRRAVPSDQSTREHGESSREPTFALRPVNPVVGTCVVYFRLPSSGEASLTLYDVSGRLVASRGVGARGPGWQSVDLGALPAGVYRAKLTHAGGIQTAPVVVIR